MVVPHSAGQGLEGLLEVVVELLLECCLLRDLLRQVLGLRSVCSLFLLSLLLQLTPFLLLLVELFGQFRLSHLERLLCPRAEASPKRATLPIQDSLTKESPSLVLLVDDIEPFVEASRDLAAVHPDDEVSHDAMGL